MYTFESRIRYSEVGQDCNLTLEALLNYFQDCSTFHSEDIGLGIEYFQENHMSWLMSSWQIIVERYPHVCEKVVIGTAPYQFKGFVGYRNFLMETESGERLAYANSVWSLMNMEKMTPMKPTQAMLDGYVLSEKLEMDYAPRKIALPPNGKEQEPLWVRAHHLDSNGHVNNGQHVQIAMEFLPKDFHIRQMRAEYKKQAVLNDKIMPLAAVNEEKTLCTVVLNGEDGRPYSIIEFAE